MAKKGTHGILGGLLVLLLIAGLIQSCGGNNTDDDDKPRHPVSQSQTVRRLKKALHKTQAKTPQKPAQKTKPAAKPQPKKRPAAPLSTALGVLNTLPVRDEDFSQNYQRVADFGKAWLDMDGNGCDTRDDILARDLQNITYKRYSDCKIASGVLHDPYTGRTIDFTRGWKTSRAVQIDHVVPLGDAWRTGANRLPFTTREQLANDPLNLLAVDGPTNIEKSDKDASQWLPPNRVFDCPYVARQVAVKKKYNLWVTGAEKNAMESVLHTCPAQGLPR